MAKVEFICKNEIHSESHRQLHQLKSIAQTLQSTLHILKEAEGAYYSANYPTYDLIDQKFNVRYELERVNEEIRILKNSIKQSDREYKKAIAKMSSEGMC